MPFGALLSQRYHNEAARLGKCGVAILPSAAALGKRLLTLVTTLAIPVSLPRLGAPEVLQHERSRPRQHPMCKDGKEMDTRREIRSSPYLEFARLRSEARFNLATSGVAGYPLRDLPAGISELEINGPALYGYPPLIERLARLKEVAPDCVVHTNGTAMANHLAMAALLAPGDEVVIEEPAYEPLVSTALFLGARVRRFQRHEPEAYAIDPAEIARCVTERTRLIALTNLHNPSSDLATQETLQEIGKIGRKVGARVLIDEVYLETLFGRSQPSAFHLGEEFVATGSLTKAYGLGGLRCGWILAAPPLAQKLWKLNDLFGVMPVHAGELLSVAALDHLPAIARRAQEMIKANRSALRAVAGDLDPLELSIPDQGTTVFPRLVQGKVEEFCRLLRERFETSVVPGRYFDRPDHIRIGLGGDPEMTREGLARLALALKEWKG